jgi:two-component system, NtrC family, response regulator AtoC
MAKRKVLVVDDERNMQAVLKLLLDGEGYDTACVSDGAEALAALEAGGYGVVVSDLKMNRMDGMELLRAMRDRGYGSPFVLVTAYGTIEKAVEAMRLGAVDVVTKPFAKEALLAVVARAFREGGDAWCRDAAGAAAEAEGLVYRSPAMAEIGRLLERVAPAAAPVLLTGESGTGKEVLARAIHRAYSGGSFDAKPFVSVNCPAVPESLLESELFGYRRGAFTGADQDFKGKVEQADGGSLFFDEIGDLPASIQPKLLRLLENRTFEPLGSGKTTRVDIRIVCATNRDLRRLVSEGRFREDLLYRINTFTIELPPLRERIEDIEPLAAFFLRRFAFESRKNVVGFSQAATILLRGYDWPGNVRELKNVVERAVVLCPGAEIKPDDLPRELRRPGATTLARGKGPEEARGARRPAEPEGRPASASTTVGPGSASGAAGLPGVGAPSPLESAERALLVDALARSSGNVSAAARILGITRNTMRYRMRKHELDGGSA